MALGKIKIMISRQMAEKCSIDSLDPIKAIIVFDVGAKLIGGLSKIGLF